MCGRGQAREDACLCEEEGAGADAEEGAFLLGVFLLKIGEGFDKA